MKKNSNLVYSTDTGRVKTPRDTAPEETVTDGIVRIQRETKGRGGKAVSVISGIPTAQLKDITKKLKSACAGGGAIKGQNIEIQGDHRERIKTLLESAGYHVKLSGG